MFDFLYPQKRFRFLFRHKTLQPSKKLNQNGYQTSYNTTETASPDKLL